MSITLQALEYSMTAGLICMCLQAPLLAYNHFVEAVFVLNECRSGLQSEGLADEPLSQLTGSADSRAVCSLAGPSPTSRAKRDTIYR
jgi:hypothetical protein